MSAARRLAAILAADVAGYSWLMWLATRGWLGADEEGTHRRLRAHFADAGTIFERRGQPVPGHPAIVCGRVSLRQAETGGVRIFMDIAS